ncbi:MAG TPA: YibE/F family protein [Spirochaetota bacterium]|nr:YibE/F family protein [Spirochaetota bacterium]
MRSFFISVFKKIGVLPANKKDLLWTVFSLILIIFLLFLPTGFARKQPQNTVRVKARVLQCDNSDLNVYGLVRQGTQTLKLEILSGTFKKKRLRVCHSLAGRLELDTFFHKGDSVLTVLTLEDNKIVNAVVVDHYRLDEIVILFSLFVILLLAFAGFTGFRALLSFLLTGLTVWKLLLPAFLKGYNPLLISFGVLFFLTVMIIFLVAGINKKGLTAISGALSGIIVTIFLSAFFGHFFQIHGAVKPFSETLLYSGFTHLDLSAIFLAGIFIASSGAIMDIGMDIAASMAEIKQQKPLIKRKELIKSGFTVGRAVVGTMTTTLLFAYSGGYTALLMVFMAQNTPPVNMINIRYVAAEILHTLVGSFGLVAVAPLTAVAGGFIMGGKKYTYSTKAGLKHAAKK